jgi:hypothetical protein
VGLYKCRSIVLSFKVMGSIPIKTIEAKLMLDSDIVPRKWSTRLDNLFFFNCTNARIIYLFNFDLRCSYNNENNVSNLQFT